MQQQNQQQALRIATRSSALALAQTTEVITQLGVECEVIKVHNEAGDVNQQDPLYQLGSVGVFTKEVEQIQGKADVAVHSLKDLPTILDPRLVIAAYSKLGDIVILNSKYQYKSMVDLPDGFILGTSSLRRVTSVQNKYPKLILKNIRGNLNTRLSKLDAGEYDGIILAKAGITRLGLQDRISWDLDEKEFMYAPGQGALGIQCRIDDQTTFDRLRVLNDKESEMRCVAERQFLNQLEGGCKLPIAVFSELVGEDRVHLYGRVLSKDGSKEVHADAEDDYRVVGGVLNELIRKLGGKELLSE